MATTTYKTTAERVEAEILGCFDDGFEPGADDVAMSLIDADVASGAYDGCSTESEIAYTEYLAAAEKALGS